MWWIAEKEWIALIDCCLVVRCIHGFDCCFGDSPLYGLAFPAAFQFLSFLSFFLSQVHEHPASFTGVFDWCISDERRVRCGYCHAAHPLFQLGPHLPRGTSLEAVDDLSVLWCLLYRLSFSHVLSGEFKKKMKRQGLGRRQWGRQPVSMDDDSTRIQHTSCCC